MRHQARNVDFRKALRLIDGQTHVPVEVRQKAFACWVALFEFADDQLQIETSARKLAESAGVTRVTWIHYRSVMEQSGLLQIVTGSRGPNPQVLRLTPPHVH